MIGRKTVVGLSLLSALAFWALSAQSAFAEFTAATNTTAFTCVPESKGEFKDEHCDNYVGAPNGSWTHKQIPINEKTEITVTNEKTKNETKEATTAVLHGKLGGAEITITSTTVHGTGWLKNIEPELKKHRVEGETTTVFTGLSVDKIEHCKVKEPIEVKSKVLSVESGAKMGLKFEPAAGGIFAAITLENQGPGESEKCPVAGTFNVKGSVVATGQGGEEEKHGSGATLVFEGEGAEMQNLTLGGNPAFFTATLTTRMEKINNVQQNPITLTTFT